MADIYPKNIGTLSMLSRWGSPTNENLKHLKETIMPNREQDQRSQQSQPQHVKSASNPKNERSDQNEKATDKSKRTQRSDDSSSNWDNFNK